MIARRWTRFVLISFLVSILGTPVDADVFIERKLEVGLLEGQPRGVLMREWVRPDRMRYATERVFTETLPRDPTGGSTLQILRLDESVQWVFDEGDSTYLEVPLEELVATLPWIQAAAANLSRALGVPKRDWKVGTGETGASSTLLGMQARMVVIEAEGRQRTVEGERVYVLRDYLWVTRELPGGAEVERLRERLARSVGTDISFLPIAVGLFRSFPQVTRTLLEERSQIEGFPLRDSLTLQITNPGEQKVQEDQLTPLFILSVTEARPTTVEDSFYEPIAGFRRRTPE